MIENINTYILYTADGFQKRWDIPFEFLEQDDLEIFVEDVTTKEQTRVVSDYRIENDTLIYPVTANALSLGSRILIRRNTDKTQDESSSLNPFTSADVERATDKLTMIVQEHERKLSKALSYNEFSNETELDAEKYMKAVKGYAEAASSAGVYAQTAASAAQQAIADAATANAAAVEATNKAQAAGDAAEAIQDVADNIDYWLQTLEQLKDGDVKTYTAGTSTAIYDGSLTVFPVENEFAVPVNVYVNGQFKEIVTEYSENRVNNTITFTSALNVGDKVNIVANLALASLDSLSTVVASAISTHNSSLMAHNSLISDLQNNKLENSATGTNAVTILGTSSAGSQSTNAGKTSNAISYGTAYGYGASVTGVAGTAVGTNSAAGTYATAIGGTHDTANAQTVANGDASIAIGHNAKATATGAIQIGAGTNATSNTLQIGSTTLLDASGKIPLTAISSTLVDNAYQRQFTPVNAIIANGTAAIAGEYTLSQLPDDNKIRICYFEVSIQLSASVAEYSSLSLATDVFTTGTTVVGTNNGFKATTTVSFPLKRKLTIDFPSIAGGVDGASVRFLGYF